MIRLYLAIGLLVAFSALGWYAKHQTERAATAEQAAQIAAETADAWRMALEQQTARAQQTDRLLAESARGYETLRRKTETRIANYETTRRADETTDHWDRVPVPAVVADRLREYADHAAGADPVPAGAAAVHGPGADPATYTNGDLWRWTERLIEGWDRFNADRTGVSRWAGSVDAVSSAPPR